MDMALFQTKVIDANAYVPKLLSFCLPQRQSQ